MKEVIYKIIIITIVLGASIFFITNNVLAEEAETENAMERVRL